MKIKRVVPEIRIADGHALTLRQLGKAKDAPISRSYACFRAWITRGVKSADVIVHMPGLEIQGIWYSSVPALRAFLAVLQDYSQATVAELGDKLGPPVVALKGDVFKGMG